MEALSYAIGATIMISLISLAGIVTLGVKKQWLHNLLFWMVSFSTGSLMGGAFFHLLPEALEENEALMVFKIVAFGFAVFYILEKMLRWHHCHDEDCESHKHIGYQNLFGDAVHNFIDGLIIVSTFMVDVKLGMVATVSVALHEIPQEIGDFGVLLYSGFSKTRAIWFNLISASTAIAGAVIGYLLIEQVESLVHTLLPFAAGGFIYIASADLIPELHKERSVKKSAVSFLFFLGALLLMLLLKD